MIEILSLTKKNKGKKIKIQIAIFLLLISLISTSCDYGEHTNNFASYLRNKENSKRNSENLLAFLPQPTKEHFPTNSELLLYSQNFGDIDNLFLSQDFQLVVGTSGNDVLIYDDLEAKSTKKIKSNNPGILIISPENEFISWVSDNNNISITNVEKKEQTPLNINNNAPITSLVFAPKSDHLAYATIKNEIKIYDISDEALKIRWSFPYWLSNLSYSSDGKTIAGVSLPSNTVYFIDVNTGEIESELSWDNPVTSKLYGGYISPDWHNIAWVSGNIVQLMDIRTGKLGPILMHKDPVTDFAWSQDSIMVASSSVVEINGELVPVVHVWDVVSGIAINTLPQNSPVRDISFSVDGKDIAIHTYGGEFMIWAIRK